MHDATDENGAADHTIIFVHGRGFKPPEADYLESVVAAMTCGVEQDSREFLDLFASTQKMLAYYGDLNNDYLSKDGEVFDERLDISDRHDTLHQLSTLDRKKGFGVKNYDRLPGKSALGEFAASTLAPLLSAIGVQKKIVSRLNRDLGEYWQPESELRASILERVRGAICRALDDDQRIMLISHSTGTIVSYDALWQLSHDAAFNDEYGDAKIDVWLTLGSPLGDSMVRRQLLGHGRRGRERFPTNVLAWHNVAAEDDYVSHDPTVADDFKAMMKQRQISSIRDYRIYNLAVRYGRSDPHCSLGYLCHPRVAKVLVDWLQKSRGRALPMNNSS